MDYFSIITKKNYYNSKNKEILEDAITNLIRYGFYANYRDEFVKHIDKLIIEYNFDINTQDNVGDTLLHHFICYCDYTNDLKHIQYFINKGASLNIKNNLGRIPLFNINHIVYSISKLFIDNGCDVNIRDNNNKYALYYKANGSNNFSYYELLPLIEATQIDFDSDFEYESKLHFAVLFRNKDKMIEYTNNNLLINSYAKTKDYFADKYVTPLSIACKNGFYEEYLYLLENGAKINDPNTNLLRDIISNVYNFEDKIKILNHLISIGYDVKKYTLQIILKHHYGINIKYILQIIDILIKNGVNIRQKINLEKGFFSYEYYYNCVNYHNYYFYGYFNYINYVSIGAEPLHYITDRYHNYNINIYEKFFEYGADPNAPNYYGTTPFMLLFCKYYIDQDILFDLVKLFIKNGADLYQKDSFGNCAYNILYKSKTIKSKLKIEIINYLYDNNKLPKSDLMIIKNFNLI